MLAKTHKSPHAIFTAVILNSFLLFGTPLCNSLPELSWLPLQLIEKLQGSVKDATSASDI